ncbi:hypothetical protein OROMI_008964 [Orobanche minor]
MAFRRSITARAKLIHQQQRFAAPFSHLHRDDDDRESLLHNKPISRNPNIPSYIQHRLFGSGNKFGTFYRSSFSFQDHKFAIPAACGPHAFVRNMSSLGDGQGDKIEIMSDIADVLGDKAVEVASQAGPVANEVAIAAADSFLPVAALQYLIDYVHCYIGLNWWASIVVTTLLIRWIQLPIMINTIKSSTKFAILRPRLEEIKEEMQSRDMSPAAVVEGQARMKQLFKEYGIMNMSENVASFKEGGTLWFTDLTTPDSMYIFPVLTALTFWITVECNAQEGLEGNPTAGTIKNVSRIFAALTIPFTATFPKAIFCYWITSNLFSLAYGLVLKKPEVKKFLGIPNIPVTPISTNQKPGFSFFEALKKYADSQQHHHHHHHHQQSLSAPAEMSSKPANHKISSSSVLSQRIRSLEKEVKGRKKGKKR